MPNPVQAPFFQFFIPATGAPAENYVVKFFEAGTTTPKDIYTDAALTTPYSPAGEMTLNAQGYAIGYPGSGAYKVQVVDEDDAQVFLIDDIVYSGSFGTGFVETFADLLDVNTDANAFTYIAGYYAPGDGGHGMFRTDTAAVADGGYIQDSDYDPTKSWFRIPDENGDVRAASFGYIGTTAGNQTSAMQAADAYAVSVDARLRIGLGTSATLATMNFSSNVIFEGSGITGTGAPTIGFNGKVEGPPVKLFYSMTVTITGNALSVLLPEWWGAVGDGATDDLVPISAMFDNTANEYYFRNALYVVTGDPGVPSQGTIRANGAVKNGGTFYVRHGLRVLDTTGQVKADLVESASTVTVGTLLNMPETAITLYLYDEANSLIDSGAGTYRIIAGMVFLKITDQLSGAIVASDIVRLTSVGDTALPVAIRAVSTWFGPVIVDATAAKMRFNFDFSTNKIQIIFDSVLTETITIRPQMLIYDLA